MNDTLKLIIALLPIAEKLIINGVEIVTRKDMTNEEMIDILERAKKSLPDMPNK